MRRYDQLPLSDRQVDPPQGVDGRRPLSVHLRQPLDLEHGGSASIPGQEPRLLKQKLRQFLKSND